MTDTVSLGLTRPSALSYLIQESNLPRHVIETSYCWHTRQASDAHAEEELLYTPDCVIWSIDGNVKKLFHFHSEDRTVVKALLTAFPYRVNANAASTLSGDPFATRKAAGSHHAQDYMQRTARWGTQGHESRFVVSADAASSLDAASAHPKSPFAAHALVIVLVAEVQVHFLAGPSHVVNLPFEIQDAFSSWEGIIVRRRALTAARDVSSPGVPPPPPNSFFSSQDFLLSQSKTGQFEAMPQLDALFRDIVKDKGTQGGIDVPVYYSLADPLSDFAAVSHASLSRTSRLSRLEDPEAVLVDHDPLEADEEIVYVSAKDELTENASPGDEPLLFIVTMNRQSQQITIWQSWYLKPRTLSAMLTQRAAQKATRAGQRSSFTSTTRTAGVTTPAVRHRDRVRESLAASLRLPTESQHSGLNSQSQDDEEVMASQMDPEYLPLKQPANASKRVSSLLSRAEVVNVDPSIRQTALGASFGGGGRRGPSIGSFNDRRSFGSHVYRKSRGSTPGSLFNRSLGQGDDLGESGALPGEMNYLKDEYESVARLISATRESAGINAALGSGVDGMRKELIMRKLDSIPLYRKLDSSDTCAASPTNSVKAIPMTMDLVSKDGDCHVDVFILDKSSGNMTTVSYRVRRHVNHDVGDQDITGSGRTPIPMLEDRRTVSKVHDMERFRDGTSRAILYSTANGGLNMAMVQGLTWSVALPERVRLTDPTSVRDAFDQGQREIGRTRTVPLAHGPITLRNPARSGQITLNTSDSYNHCLKIRLSPRHTVLKQVLELCQYVLPRKEGRCIPMLWCNVYQRFASNKVHINQALDQEWEALIVTLFTLTAGSIGRSIHVTPSGEMQERTSHHLLTVYDSQLNRRCVRSETNALSNKAWDWLDGAHARQKRHVPTLRPRQKRATNSRSAQEVKISVAEYEAMARHVLQDVASDDLQWLFRSDSANTRTLCASRILLVLHLFLEETKLNVNFEDPRSSSIAACLSVIIAQYGSWLSLEGWGRNADTFYNLEGRGDHWDLSSCKPIHSCTRSTLTKRSRYALD